ncbi:MAG: hypothetical protein A2X18_11670 [Bacteroidetes bacterium GWF2_40_14]|nr:MAG: hypothetical protein A2X18_11670 [Bacteroidetes bacterium GWF2_40_14]
MNDIKAIFFDIDGTLVSFNTHKVPQSAIDSIAALRANGIKTFVATGRMIGALNVVESLKFDGYVAYNGAYCVTAEGKLVFSSPIDRNDLVKLANMLENDHFPVAFMKLHETTINYVDNTVLEVLEQINLPVPRIEDPFQTIKEDVYQICIYSDTEKERQILDEVLHNCISNRWSNLFADINMRGNHKSSGMDHMITHFGIDLKQTMAFGDGGNDIPMLKHAAIGIAMGNADKNVKSNADYITDTVDCEGISKALEFFKLI